MDLKETKHLTTLADIKLHTNSERNKSDTQEMYNMLFSEEEKLNEIDIDINQPNKDIGKTMFGEVTTLDWIKTWRVFEIN